VLVSLVSAGANRLGFFFFLDHRAGLDSRLSSAQLAFGSIFPITNHYPANKPHIQQQLCLRPSMHPGIFFSFFFFLSLFTISCCVASEGRTSTLIDVSPSSIYSNTVSPVSTFSLTEHVLPMLLTFCPSIGLIIPFSVCPPVVPPSHHLTIFSHCSFTFGVLLVWFSDLSHHSLYIIYAYF